MKVLIVEDNEDKARQIIDVVSQFAVSETAHVRGLRAAYPALERVRWDLVILDMTLHAAEGNLSASSKESLAGIEVLQAINAGPEATAVIVATQHDVFRQDPLHFESIDSLDAALRDAFPNLYRGVVRVKLGTDEWKVDMASRIGEVLGRF
ncbi:response regulator [Aminobacter aganoensis]|uniref:CheY-like chemotaxis protein n=1 Tax=Aminobacter aganoensis TaxID=83264 RepID=A0A7X0KMR9_9HYPH|nr:response regulator [Aminobacter aganoensis]MBB6356339.1 CheY-like chemotaxis protein [Aminobacter aganoensis]